MPAIRLPKEPTQRYSPAPGYVDEVDQALSAVRTDLQAVLDADDDYTKPLHSPGVAAHDSLEDVRVFLWKVGDDYSTMLGAVSGFAAAQQDAAAAGVSQYGHGNGAMYEQAVSAARANAARQVQRTTATSVLAKPEVSTKASAIAAAAVETMEAFDLAIASAQADNDGPVALRTASVSIDDLHRQASLEQEIRTWERPMKRSYDLVQGFLQRGETEKLSKLLVPLRTCALEIRDTSPAKLNQRFANAGGAGRAGVIDSERDLAWRLLKLLSDFRKSQSPASLTAANAAADKLDRIFAQLLGRPPSLMGPDERDRYFASDTSGSGIPWKVAPDWFSRYLPPSTLALSGWSPPIGRAAMTNATIRQAARR